MPNARIKLDVPSSRVVAVDRRGYFERHVSRVLTDIIARLGGPRDDFVQSGRRAALESEAMVRAVIAGLATGYYHTPAESSILDFTPTSDTTATITVAEHTRSTAAATIEAGEVLSVTRNLVYYVYYTDGGDAGGAVTFNATTDVSDLLGASTRTVGAIFVEPPIDNGAAS